MGWVRGSRADRGQLDPDISPDNHTSQTVHTPHRQRESSLSTKAVLYLDQCQDNLGFMHAQWDHYKHSLCALHTLPEHVRS